MSGTLIKAGVGVVLVAASAKLGQVAQELLGRARESVQASELLSIDGQLAAWAIEQKRTRPPRDQAHFEVVLRELFQAGGRDVTKDRWGQAYVYEKVHDRPVAWTITSTGPDKRLGTADDLVVSRYDDRVQINQDPTKIMEQALETKRRADERFFQDLERVAARAGKPREALPADLKLDLAPLREQAGRSEGAAFDGLLRP